MKQKVRGQPNLIRDSASKAILFTNHEEVKAYQKKKQQMESQNSQINTLKKEIAELKDLVHRLLERQEKQ
jgi:hypothetical protein